MVAEQLHTHLGGPSHRGSRQQRPWAEHLGELAPLFGLQRSATARGRVESLLTSYSVRDFRTLKQPGTIAEVLDHGADNTTVLHA